MKKLTLLAVLSTLVLASCTENKFDTTVDTETLPDLTAEFADGETKTYVDNNKYLRWHEADLITAFYGNVLNRQYKFNGITGDNSGTFSLVPSGELGTGNTLDAIYAVYPYDAGATITDEGTISLTLPATQTYAENSFGRGANTMIAVTENIEDTFLGFKNACGYLKIKLYAPEGGIVKSISIKGNNNEKIAGSATATIKFSEAPIVAMSENATTSITLDCGIDGVILGTSADTATEFWFVLPEVTFEAGITISGLDVSGELFTQTTNKQVVIKRNTIQPMAALELSDIKIKVGDIINYNGGLGIVYSIVDSTAKLVSVTSAKKTWAKSSYANKSIYTENFEDGRANLQIIKDKGILDSFPAFAWCDAYGEGWYLPAYKELTKIEDIKDLLNEILIENGYSKFSGWYWSSTESNYDKVWGTYLDNTYSMQDCYKASTMGTIAVATIELN